MVLLPAVHASLLPFMKGCPGSFLQSHTLALLFKIFPTSDQVTQDSIHFGLENLLGVEAAQPLWPSSFNA